MCGHPPLEVPSSRAGGRAEPAPSAQPWVPRPLLARGARAGVVRVRKMLGEVVGSKGLLKHQALQSCL